MNLSKKQLSILKHMLGVDRARRVPYRNYYATTPDDSEIAEMNRLGAVRLCRKATDYSTFSYDCYECTEAGKIAAIESLKYEYGEIRAFKTTVDEEISYVWTVSAVRAQMIVANAMCESGWVSRPNPALVHCIRAPEFDEIAVAHTGIPYSESHVKLLAELHLKNGIKE